MVTLNNVITDYDLELQRFLEGHETTRGPNSKINAKQLEGMNIKRNI